MPLRFAHHSIKSYGSLFLPFYCLQDWRTGSQNHEKHESNNKRSRKKEQIHFQFETLKSQINPHFMFNSFNTLIGLIEEDKQDASDYVEKLSDLFRKCSRIPR